MVLHYILVRGQLTYSFLLWLNFFFILKIVIYYYFVILLFYNVLGWLVLLWIEKTYILINFTYYKYNQISIKNNYIFLNYNFEYYLLLNISCPVHYYFIFTEMFYVPCISLISIATIFDINELQNALYYLFISSSVFLCVNKKNVLIWNMFNTLKLIILVIQIIFLCFVSVFIMAVKCACFFFKLSDIHFCINQQFFLFLEL